MPTGPNCDMDFDHCMAFAKEQGMDDPEGYCKAQEQKCKDMHEDRLRNRAPHKFWSFKNASDNPQTGELTLYGLIGPDDGMGWLFDEISPKAFKAELDALGPISELRIFINSEGGDVFAGQAIHSMLKRHKAHKTVHIDGLAASIASVVAMAGDQVIMPRNAMLMIHNPFCVTVGDADKHRHQAQTLDQVRESIIAAYEGKTGMDRDALVTMMQAETWMTADDCMAMGFCDEIAEAEMIAASLVAPGVVLINGHAINLSRFSNPPTFPGVGSKTPDAYTAQAQTVMAAVSAFEARTMIRHDQRAKAGRGLSEADVRNWRQIRDAASRILAKCAAKPGPSEGQKLWVDYQKNKAARAARSQE